MPKYRITFDDGHEIELERENGDRAKIDARHTRARETGAKDRTDPRIKVKSVTRLTPHAGE